MYPLDIDSVLPVDMQIRNVFDILRHGRDKVTNYIDLLFYRSCNSCQRRMVLGAKKDMKGPKLLPSKHTTVVHPLASGTSRCD